MARPITTSYSDKEKQSIIEHVLAELAAGRAVSRILAEDDGMPAASCFWNWHYTDEQLQENLARAREHGASVILDEALQIADTPQMGMIVKSKPIIEDGEEVGEREEVTREDMLGHRKLQVETRIKMAQMIAPRKYGPKLDLTSGGQPIAEIDDTARAMRLAAVLNKARENDDHSS